MQACLQNWGLVSSANPPPRAAGQRPGDLGRSFPAGSIAQQLAAAKSVFVEPMRATADEFDAVLSRYKDAASAGSGAVLFGVLRGRASEGLNFSHDHARGVVPSPSQMNVNRQIVRINLTDSENFTISSLANMHL